MTISTTMTKQTSSTEKRREILEVVKGLNGTPESCEVYDKMVSGMLYDPMDPVLLQIRLRTRGLAQDYNSMDTRSMQPDEAVERRLEVLRKLLGKIGEGTYIEPPFLPDYGCNVSIGKNTFINWNVTILDTSIVIIGDNVQIASNVSIISAGHETSVLTRQKFVEFGHPVYIEDDVWLGANVIVLHGVTIGKGSTVGAGAIVTKDIPPYSVAVGAPARVIKTVPTPEEEMQDPNNPYREIVAMRGKYAI